MATSAPELNLAPAAPRAARAAALTTATYLIGGLALAVEAGVHIQQYTSIFHSVGWIGPLFLANGAACLLATGGLASSRLRPAAALAGIAISVSALAGLVLSYGTGLFGWTEAGWRTPIALAVASEVCAVVALATAQLLASGSRGRYPGSAPGRSPGRSAISWRRPGQWQRQRTLARDSDSTTTPAG
jgi:hypothetical protein